MSGAWSARIAPPSSSTRRPISARCARRCSKPSATPSSSAGTSIAKPDWSARAAAPRTVIPRGWRIFSRRWSTSARGSKSRCCSGTSPCSTQPSASCSPPIRSAGIRRAACHFCLDNAVPFGSSQHQKLIVIDDAVAFTGGLDVTIRRWDTSEHEPDNPLRRDPAGDPYKPFHDVQMMVDGDGGARARRTGAGALAVRGGRARPAAQDAGDLWPRRGRRRFYRRRSRHRPHAAALTKTSRRCARSKRSFSTASRPPNASPLYREPVLELACRSRNALAERLRQRPAARSC